MKPLARLLLVLLLALTTLPALAAAAAAEEIYSERTLQLSRELECPVCQGQTVADSNSQLAREMRDIIEQKVQAGESDEQILQYFVDRYGQGILAEPPKEGFTLALWWLPVLVVALGLVVVVSFLRERTHRRATDDDELERLAREVLGEGQQQP